MDASGKTSVNLSGFSSVAAGLTGGAQTLTTSTWTVVGYDSVRHDKLSEFDYTTDHDFTAIQGGYYDISASVQFASWIADEYAVLSIRKNGVDMFLENVSHCNTTAWSISVHGKMQLDAGDVVDVRVYQHSGGDKDLVAAANKTNLFISRYA